MFVKDAPKKYFCECGHFVKVRKQSFFYNPDADFAKEAFFLSKYESLSHAIECKDYNFIDYTIITNVELLETMSDGSKYGDIEIETHPTTKEGFAMRGKRISYTNISPNAKIRKYFERAKRWIDANKCDFEQREEGETVQEL